MPVHPFDTLVYEAADKLANMGAPGGVATHSYTQFTSQAFDFYIAKHGVPTTANQARRLFEFAAVLESTATYFLGRRR